MELRAAFVTFLIGAAICVPLVVIGAIADWSSGATGLAVVGGIVVTSLIGSTLYDRELEKLDRR